MASIFFNYLFFFYKKKKFEFDKEKTFHQTKRVGKNYREKYALFTHFSLICVCVCVTCIIILHSVYQPLTCRSWMCAVFIHSR